MIKNTLHIKHHTGEYPIYIGNNLLNDTSLFNKHIASQQVLITSNDIVAGYYLDIVENNFTDYQCNTAVVPDGEHKKTLETLRDIIDVLIEHNHHRDTTLIALGGGVIGDMTGFAASCYQRGVNFIQVPTTLLAQIDASIGGKTAVNHPAGKNMIGAFFQPKAVIIDINTLATLPDREFSAGIAEMIKVALLADAEFFNWLQSNMPQIMAKDEETLITAISKSCQIKADIVNKDEKEQGVRALLNLGHTFGHAIEQNLGFGTVLHGEAVAIGMLLAAQLSAELKHLSNNDVEEITELLERANLPTQLPTSLDAKTLIETMWQDKKVLQKQMRFILLQSIGHAYIDDSINEAQLLKLLQQ